MGLISKAAAKALGLKRYFTGIPCLRGHIAERYVTGACIGCYQDPAAKEKDRLRASANYKDPVKRALHLASLQKSMARPEAKERKKAYSQQDHVKELARMYDKEYRTRESVRERQSAYLRQWCENNPGKMEEYELKRELRKSLATPPWADVPAIVEFYKARPNGYHVDHIIPLQGKLVSGLNVLNNLQYLTPSENCSKGNRFDPATYQSHRDDADMSK